MNSSAAGRDLAYLRHGASPQSKTFTVSNNFSLLSNLPFLLLNPSGSNTQDPVARVLLFPLQSHLPSLPAPTCFFLSCQLHCSFCRGQGSPWLAGPPALTSAWSDFSLHLSRALLPAAVCSEVSGHHLTAASITLDSVGLPSTALHLDRVG